MPQDPASTSLQVKCYPVLSVALIFLNDQTRTQVFMIVLTFNGNFPCLVALAILTSLCKLLVSLMSIMGNTKATSKQPLTFNPKKRGGGYLGRETLRLEAAGKRPGGRTE